MPKIEICVDSVEGLAIAIKGGADRIELCSALSLGGLSPSLALLEAAKNSPVPVYVMVRPRVGSFLYSGAELNGMEQEIVQVKQMGLSGVVIGAGSETGLDWTTLNRLTSAADGLGMTLHRVVDLISDRSNILTQSRDLGFERILTSGGSKTAQQGLPEIAKLVSHAPEGLSIMPGSGVTPENAREIIQKSGAHEIHASASVSVQSNARQLVDLGFEPECYRETSLECVSAIKSAILQNTINN